VLLLFTSEVLEGDAWAYVWPVAVILAGLLIVARWSGRVVPRGTSREDVIRSTAIFGGPKLVSGAQSLKGAWLTAIFGGITLDLRGARPDRSGASINATAVFGAIDILVPKGWRLSVRSTPIFGGLEDKTDHSEPTAADAPISMSTPWRCSAGWRSSTRSERSGRTAARPRADDAGRHGGGPRRTADGAPSRSSRPSAQRSVPDARQRLRCEARLERQIRRCDVATATPSVSSPGVERGFDPNAPTVGPPPHRPGAAPPVAARPGGRSGGRMTAVTIGALLALLAAVVAALGVAGVVADQTRRDDQGFVMSPMRTYSTDTFLLVSDALEIDVRGPDWGDVADDLVGDVKVRSSSAEPVFVGIGPADAVAGYVTGVPQERLSDLADHGDAVIPGAVRPDAPAAQDFWVAASAGAGERALRWNVEDGDWRLVVMRADAERGVTTRIAVGSEQPALLGTSLALLAGGGMVLVLAGLLLHGGVRGRR
jgi:hypothetical protein